MANADPPAVHRQEFDIYTDGSDLVIQVDDDSRVDTVRTQQRDGTGININAPNVGPGTRPDIQANGSTIVAGASAINFTGGLNVVDNGSGTATTNVSGVGTSELASAAVTSPKIANGTISSADIGASAIQAGDIGDEQVTTTEIASGAVTGTEILNGGVDTDQMAANAVTSSEIQPSAIQSGDVGDSQIRNQELSTGAVGQDGLNQLAAGTITLDGSTNPGFDGSAATSITTEDQPYMVDLYVSAGVAGSAYAFNYDHNHQWTGSSLTLGFTVNWDQRPSGASAIARWEVNEI